MRVRLKTDRGRRRVTAAAPDRVETARTKRTRLGLEHREQRKLFEWAEQRQSDLPELAMLFAVPNGSHKSIVAAMKFKREGLRSGVPDVQLAVPVGGFAGLFIEMKSPGADANAALGLRARKPGQLSDEQAIWLKALADRGYAIAVCWTADQAQTAVIRYLAGRHRNQPYLNHFVLPTCAKLSRN